jgi:hypothetical protein
MLVSLRRDNDLAFVIDVEPEVHGNRRAGPLTGLRVALDEYLGNGIVEKRSDDIPLPIVETQAWIERIVWIAKEVSGFVRIVDNQSCPE